MKKLDVANTPLLRLFDLPVFSSIDELASIMHVSSNHLIRYSENSFERYIHFQIPKSKVGFRDIYAPYRELKGIQAWILRYILDKLSISPYATAYIRGKSIYDNVQPHINNRYFICIDLKDFFPSISYGRVVKMFSRLGYSVRAAEILANFCTYKGKLPQGAVTSPSISNIISSQLDRRIAGYTAKRNITYTRYADDITLSSNNRNSLNQALLRIRKIIQSEHFLINEEKLRILGPRKRVSVTGLIKNTSNAKFGIGRKTKRHMRSVIHNHLIGNNIDKKYLTEASINGWLSYLKGVDLETFTNLNQYIEKLKIKYTK